MINYYTLLKISPDISHEELEKSFVEFKKELASFSPGVKLSEEELEHRNPVSWKAYTVLLDKSSRLAYDQVLERELAHNLYEHHTKAEGIEPAQLVASKRKPILLSMFITVLIVIVYFILNNRSSSNLKEYPDWKHYSINENVEILLPNHPDSTGNILPPYLLGFLKNSSCVISCLSNGFSVTVANLELYDNYVISFRDINYVGSMEMQNPHAKFTRDPNESYMNAKGYKLLVTKGTYQLDDVLRAYDNYTFINKSKAIKVVVNYVPGNLLHEKYAEIVLKSLLQK